MGPQAPGGVLGGRREREFDLSWQISLRGRLKQTLIISVNDGVRAAPTKYPRLILITSSNNGGRQQLSLGSFSSSSLDPTTLSLDLFLKSDNQHSRAASLMI